MRDLSLRLVVDDSQKSKLTNFATAAQRAQADMEKQLSPSTLLRAESAANRLGSSINRVATVAMTAMTVQATVLAGAMRKLGTEFISVNEKFAGLQITMASAMKSMGAAREVTKEIARLTAASPLPFQSIAGIAQSFAVIPATTNRLLQDVQQRKLGTERSFLKKALQTVEAMNAFRPDQDADSAIFAIREAMGGQIRSLVRRFDVPASLLSTVSGKSMDKLKNNPDQMFEAINKLFTSIISPDAISQYARLPTKLMDNLVEQIFEIPLLKLGSGDVRKKYEKLTTDMYVAPYDQLITKASQYYDDVVKFMQSSFETKFLGPMRTALTVAMDRAGKAIGKAVSTILDSAGISGKGYGIERIAEFGAKGLTNILDLTAKAIEYITQPEFISGITALFEGLNKIGNWILKTVTSLSSISPALGPLAVLAAPFLLNNIGSILRLLAVDLPKSFSSLGRVMTEFFGIIKPSTSVWAKQSAGFRAQYQNFIPSALDPKIIGNTAVNFRNAQTGAFLPSMSGLAKADYLEAFKQNAQSMGIAHDLLVKNANGRAGYDDPRHPAYQAGLATIAERQRIIDQESFSRGDRRIHEALARNPTGMDWVGQGEGFLPYGNHGVDVNKSPSRISRFGNAAKGIALGALEGLGTGLAIAGLIGAFEITHEALTANSRAIAANTEAILKGKANLLDQSITPQVKALGLLMGKDEKTIRAEQSARLDKEFPAIDSLNRFLSIVPKTATGAIGAMDSGKLTDSLSTLVEKGGLSTSSATEIRDYLFKAGILSGSQVADVTTKSRVLDNTWSASLMGSDPKYKYDPAVMLQQIAVALQGQLPSDIQAKLTASTEDLRSRISSDYLNDLTKQVGLKFGGEKGQQVLDMVLPAAYGTMNSRSPAEVFARAQGIGGRDATSQAIKALDAINQATAVTDARQSLASSYAASDPYDAARTAIASISAELKQLAPMKQVLADNAKSGEEVSRVLRDTYKFSAGKATPAMQDLASTIANTLGTSQRFTPNQFGSRFSGSISNLISGTPNGPLMSNVGLDYSKFGFGSQANGAPLINFAGYGKTQKDLAQEVYLHGRNNANSAQSVIALAAGDAQIGAVTKVLEEGNWVEKAQAVERLNSIFNDIGISFKAMPLGPNPSMDATAMSDAIKAQGDWLAHAYKNIELAANYAKDDKTGSKYKAIIAAYAASRAKDPFNRLEALQAEFGRQYDPSTGRLASNASPATRERMAREGLTSVDGLALTRRQLMPDTFGGDKRAVLDRQYKVTNSYLKEQLVLKQQGGLAGEAAAERAIALQEELNGLLEQQAQLAYSSNYKSMFDGFIDGMGVAKNQFVDFMRLGQQMGDVLSSSLGNAFGNIATQTESVSEAFRNMARDILNSMARILANQAAASLLANIFGAYLTGGNGPMTSTSSTGVVTSRGGATEAVSGGYSGFDTMAYRASGGPITGGSGVRDDVPIMAMGGEYVINKRAAQMYGYDNLALINSGRMPGYADGGYVPSAYSMSPASPQNGGGRMTTINITINKDGKATTATSGDNAESDIMTALARQIEGLVDVKLREAQRMGNSLNPIR